MKCRKCRGRIQPHHIRAGYDLCGCCQIAEAGTVMTELPAAVPAHFNAGLGIDIEGRDHLKREREKAKAAGVIADWE